MAEPVQETAALDDRSRWIDLDGPVHYLDFGGPADAPVVVGVHGLGGSAVNWTAVAPMVTDRCRLLAPDLAGHGLTRPMGRGTAVAANRALLHRFVESIASGPVILMGNSMGGMISLLEAASAPARVAGLILVDAALPMVPALPDPTVAALFAAYATPLLGGMVMDRRRRLSPEALVAATLSLCCVDVSRVPADVIAQHVAVARRRVEFTDVDRAFLAAARSVVATAGYLGGRPYRRAIRSIAAPVLLLHGARDRLVPLAAARAAARRNPSWSLVVLPDVGHVPQLEAPRVTATAILDWLDSAGRSAAQAATGQRARTA
jgi:pimeloyl-ACP methyl ester carboxylesterase